MAQRTTKSADDPTLYKKGDMVMLDMGQGPYMWRISATILSCVDPHAATEDGYSLYRVRIGDDTKISTVLIEDKRLRWL